MDMKSVLVLVADTKYIPHAKSVLVNARRQGEWKGDCCLILPPDCNKADFEARGIHVLTDPEPTYFRKFALFDDFFQKWEIVLYLDCDVMIQNPLEPLLHELRWGEIIADNEPFDLLHAFTHWATPEDLAKPESKATFEWLRSEYDANSRQFNTGCMAWHPRTLPSGPRERLRTMREKVAPINSHCARGTDQPIINLAFHNRFRTIRSDLVCYWRSAHENTIVVHTCSGYGPWIEKKPDMDCYKNEKLGRPYYDLYRENLKSFDEVFPRKA